jgi:phosphate transport system substrate-binding protein
MPLEPEDTLPTDALVPVEEPIAPGMPDVVPEIASPLLESARSAGHSRLILVPRNCTDAYAYWEIPADANVALQQQGAQKLVLRLYDVTGIDIAHQPPESLQEFDCDAQAQDRHLPIRTDDRDYLAELGYVADDGRWLQVARSETVRVPACPPQSTIAPDAETSVHTQAPVLIDEGMKIGGAALAGDAGIAGSVVAGGVAPTDDTVARTMIAGDRSNLPLNTEESRIILVPLSQMNAYVYWEVPDDAKESLRQQGGQTLALRLYDVTSSINRNQPPLLFEQFDADELAHDQHLSLAASHSFAPDDRAYAVELGYVTSDDRWLKLARSAPVRVASPKDSASLATDSPSNMALAKQAAIAQSGDTTLSSSPGATPISAFASEAPGAEHDLASGSAQLPGQSQVFLVPRNGQNAYVYWNVTQADKDALKHQGGQQLVLRVYDVTGAGTPSAYSVQQFLCNEWDRDQQVPIPVSNLDYVAELGYTTLDGRFLKLARSPQTRISGA